jgi:hypothetical protein
MPLAFTPERFWARFTPEPNTGCFLWTGAVTRDGYGSVRTGNQSLRVPRIAWALTHGPAASDEFVCHRCDNPLCGNPAHLFLGSHSDNMRDMAAKGRANPPRGSACCLAKLTESEVRDIRRRAARGESQRSIARAYGLRHNSISYIVRRINWAHLADEVAA